MVCLRAHTNIGIENIWGRKYVKTLTVVILGWWDYGWFSFSVASKLSTVNKKNVISEKLLRERNQIALCKLVKPLFQLSMFC